MSGVMIAAPRSGSGKTMVTCGLLALLQRKGQRPCAFKCGPDYIDGLFHRKVLGVESRNLDLFFEEPEQMKSRFYRWGAGRFAVVEGAMGYYDGLGGTTLKASAWEVADTLDLPVLLVVDAHGAGLSLAAQIQGFLEFKTGGSHHIAGILFNRMSPGMYRGIKEAVEERLRLPVVGYVPRLDFLKVDSRHLGLVLPGEIEGLKEQMEQLGDCLAKSVDVDQILKIGAMAGSGADNHEDGWSSGGIKSDIVAGGGTAAGCHAGAGVVSGDSPKKFCLGVAMDEAFCFYYRENLEAMEEAGARLVYFSPVHDKKLPSGLGGLILGGGYPENYALELWKNEGMRRAVAEAAEAGMPIHGECGGYLYLLKELEDAHGQTYPMAGVFEGKGYPAGRNSRFGYITVTANRELPFLEQGAGVKAHEFHYWECRAENTDFVMSALKPSGGRSWPCMRVVKQTVAGFPHLYYPSSPQWIGRFAEKCMEYKSI